MSLYKIVRFYKARAKPSKTVSTGHTLEEVKEHCSDPKSKGPDSGDGTPTWFDGWTKQ